MLERAARFISQYESFRAHPYDDATGRRVRQGEPVEGTLTIGYGETDPEWVDQWWDEPDGVPEPVAWQRLVERVRGYAEGVDQAVIVPLNESQRVALTSFAYNVGLGEFGRSTLLRQLNAGRYDRVRPELMRWVNAGSAWEEGLTRRREAEADLFEEVIMTLSGDTERLHPVLLARLRKLRRYAEFRVHSGWRSSAEQEELWRRYQAGTGNPANPPGTSNHEAVPWGEPMALAADLDGDLDSCHSHAAEVGLWFPIRSEPWHVQPVEVTTAQFTGVPEFPESPDDEGDLFMALTDQQQRDLAQQVANIQAAVAEMQQQVANIQGAVADLHPEVLDELRAIRDHLQQ